MGILDGLKPEKVFRFFEEITQIPHGSYNLDGIRSYLIEFAEKRNIECIADEAGNVIFKSPATPGYENSPIVVLQGHMDMVAVCETGIGFDMKTTPLDVFTDGDLIGARHTSLGGDNGIAVAMMLAILDSDDIPHPPLEMLITANEETGMEGASGLDISNIKGRILINLDSEDEGIFTVGCAGGARVHCFLPSDAPSETSAEMSLHSISVSGLNGGHSGQMIHLGRGNAIKIIGSVLKAVSKQVPGAAMTDIKGGSADNAIPSSCTAVVMIPGADTGKFLSAANAELEKQKNKYKDTDPGFEFTVETGNAESADGLITAGKAADFLEALPNGVIAMSKDVEGLVQTSLNLGIIKTEDGQLHAEFSVRSSISEERDELIDRLLKITDEFGGTNKVTGKYPGWKYATVSPLRDRMVKVFRDMYGKDPKVEAIHAGLECGFFMDKAPDIDCVSIGPDMQDIHSPAERLSISSTTRTYDYLLEVLKSMK
ncbi:MAG: aminoacyl-histidine dipeptidase [Lachnospiraceae bacterium]|nr:aminoacyl-histidine dipeptidase [Lachnospiraceae bacterium]